MNTMATGSAIAELVHYRQLLASLTWRDLKVRYKQSLLGMAWAVLMPLSMMLIFTFVFTHVTDLEKQFTLGMPYPLFAFTQTDLTGCTGRRLFQRASIYEDSVEFYCTVGRKNYRFRDFELVAIE